MSLIARFDRQLRHSRSAKGLRESIHDCVAEGVGFEPTRPFRA